MKKIFLFLTLLLLSSSIKCQELISPLWKISFTDTLTSQQENWNLEKWQNVNLLWSWERQNFSALNGNCTIASDFEVPEELKNSPLELTIGLQANVKAIYINGQFMGGKIPNYFWSNRGKTTVFSIPKGLLKVGKANRIALSLSELSYTGGISHNFLQIHPTDNRHTSTVDITFVSKNHLFNKKDQKIAFKIKTEAQRKGNLSLLIRNDFADTLVCQTYEVQGGENTHTIDLRKYKFSPGFYEVTSILNDGSYSGDVEWFTVSPEEITCFHETVQGFSDFWENTLAELKEIKPEFSLQKVDSLCSESKDGYILEMKSLNNMVIRGYYFVPKKPGSYPALLNLPGYGYGFEHHDSFLGNKDDVIQLALCVRGHGISKDTFVPYSDNPGIFGYNICEKEQTAYRGIYMDCVRAVDFLLSRPEVDKTKIGVLGGSQGGGLALATAALCAENISACAYFDPFPVDMRDHVKIRKIINREIKDFLAFYGNKCSFEQAQTTLDFLDNKGFAPQIRCPVFYGTALFDDDCPPHLGFAAYNTISSSKQYKIYAEDSHLGESNYNQDFMNFFKKQFNF
ncbi:acetylxylan esterase [Xanthovirga aplysinae]|uniref:acetylxylan esterase n=1 Tax=Xanthovirga aplysinae TaxID=2529853 RepID=UPI0012BC6054|nr:acetylxylan esterase [Xanthovirga aplysinae]MTI29587.1 hypothetical protein [Xanthovirga aplysinae]